MNVINSGYARMMAEYNIWQNSSVFQAADDLTDAARRMDRGAFFASIFGTLNHLLWGDLMWMSRFDGGTKPDTTITDSPRICDDWRTLCIARSALDQRISDWAGKLTDEEVRGDLVWLSGISGREMKNNRGQLIAHMFNHQTHHRGQVNVMMTAAGSVLGPTDLGFMPNTEKRA